MRFRWLLLLLLLSTTGAVRGQSPPPAAGSEPSVQTLLERIQQLETRISQLEDHERKQEAIKTANVTPPAAVEPQAANATQTAAPTTPPPVPQAEDHEHMGEMRESTEHYPSLQIRGFGDVDFSATDQKGSISGFNLGQFVLHFASPLSEKVSYFGEVSFTVQVAEQSGQTASKVLSIDINPAPQLTILSQSPLPAAAVGVPYRPKRVPF